MDRTFLIFAFCLVAAEAGITFKDCGSKGAAITNVEVSGCPTSGVCPFPQGTNVTLNITFTANEDLNKPTNLVHGVIAGVPVKFPVPEDCCANTYLSCPIKSGTTASYFLTLLVEPSYPKIKLLVQYEIKDDSGQDFTCIIFPAEIVSTNN